MHYINHACRVCRSSCLDSEADVSCSYGSLLEWYISYMSSQLITRMWMWTKKSQVQIPPIACFPSIKCFIYCSSLWQLNQPLVERTWRYKLNPLPLSMHSKQSTCMFTPAHSDHTIDTRKDDLKLEMQSCVYVQQILAQKYGKEMFIPGSLCTGSSYWLPSYPSVGNVPWYL